jgi:hypothetical protein
MDTDILCFEQLPSTWFDMVRQAHQPLTNRSPTNFQNLNGLTGF